MTTATEAPATTTESFAALFEESLSRQEMRAGEVITAEIVRIDQNFVVVNAGLKSESYICLLYTSPSPRDATLSRMPSSA